MDKKIAFWFKGFETAVCAMDNEARRQMFGTLAQTCLEQGSLDFYNQIWREVNGEMDTFFAALDKVEGVRCNVVVPNERYHLYFETCTCPMVEQGYIKTSACCECSRQSVEHVLQTLWPGIETAVALKQTISGGAPDCWLEIIIQKH